MWVCPACETEVDDDTARACFICLNDRTVLRAAMIAAAAAASNRPRTQSASIDEKWRMASLEHKNTSELKEMSSPKKKKAILGRFVLGLLILLLVMLLVAWWERYSFY